MPTNVGRDKKDMESLKRALLPEFQEVRAKLNNHSWDRSSEEGRIAIRKYIRTTVRSIIASLWM